MYNSTHNLINQVYAQTILVKNAELKQLQSQINPHFLYNSFYNINSLALNEDYETIIEFTNFLGQYYKYITRNFDLSSTLLEEYTHTINYCNIQKLRFSRNLSMEIGELPVHLYNIKVPKIIIQPLLENVFNYAFRTVEKQCVVYKITDENDFINISISDNGVNLTDEKIALMNANFFKDDCEDTGTININKRIKLFFGDNSCLCFSRSEFNGLNATIKISKDEIKNV